MMRISPDIWERLIKVSPEGDVLKAQLAVPDISNRLFAAIDAERRRHLLLLLAQSDPELNDTQSRGLIVTTRELEILDRGTARYFDIECRDSSGHDIFDFIGGEIANGLALPDSSPAGVVTQVLAKWRRFWGQVPRQLLSREEQLGLFAELWFLVNWMIPAVGNQVAVERWRGPFNSRHDFEWRGSSVEVKATSSSRGPIHHISSLEQLDAPADGKLMLFSMQLREERGASSTLPDMVNQCRGLLNDDLEALTVFEASLAQAGYSLAHQDEYERMHLRIIHEALYKVEGDFPRITSEHFSAGLPAGVERVEYEINLSAFSHLILAQKAEENLAFLK